MKPRSLQAAGPLALGVTGELLIPFPTPDKVSPWTSFGVTRGPHTENSGVPFLGLVCSRLNRKPTKGFIQSSEGGPPKTDFIPSHRSRRSHVGFSLFSLSISWEEEKQESRKKQSVRSPSQCFLILDLTLVLNHLLFQQIFFFQITMDLAFC